MAGTTPRLGLPYPDPTDPVTEGANDIRRLAESVEANVIGDPGAGNILIQSGRAVVDTGNAGVWTVAWPLPFGPGVQPVATLTAVEATANTNPTVVILNIDAAGVTFRVTAGNGSALPAAIMNVHWIATGHRAGTTDDPDDAPPDVVTPLVG